MSNLAKWLFDFSSNGTSVSGLVPVKSYRQANLLPEEIAIMEKAERYEADAVFFEASEQGKPSTAQAFIYSTQEPPPNDQFKLLHQRLWSWGGVPLIYRVTPGRVDLFRCAHGPDFEKNGHIVLNPFKSLLANAVNIAEDPWWNAERIRSGTLWDDPAVCKTLLSSSRAAQKTLIEEIEALYLNLKTKRILSPSLKRRLLILSILIAYLEARCVFEQGFFSAFLPGEDKFFHVLKDGRALLKLLDHLKRRFNGHVFSLSEQDRDVLGRDNTDLRRFASLIEGREHANGQLTLWQLYSFADLPVELISHIYQLFVKDSSVAVYTPHFLVRMMLGEVLNWNRLDRLVSNNEVIFDGSCGSGIFLVEAYKRLILHWRFRNNWRHPSAEVLQNILKTHIRGVDIEEGAVELTAFSLCLALCDALEPMEIRTSVQLFPKLKGGTIHSDCFFNAIEQKKIKEKVGVIVGNPPFASNLRTSSAEKAYQRYHNKYGTLPDKQLAYLFLHESMLMLEQGGVLSMLQPYSFLYNQKSIGFRKRFIDQWDLCEVLDLISINGLFKDRANTKVVVIVAEAAKPLPKKTILHATFRRSGRIEAEQGFDIDYYDMHWLPRELVLANDAVWRSDLLGGGRVLSFVDRLKKYKTLGEYSKEQGWDRGEGFIAGTSGDLSPGPHITGQLRIEPHHLKSHTIQMPLQRVSQQKFKSPYTKKRFQAPMVLVHEQENLTSRYISSGYYVYGHKIVGFCRGDGNPETLPSLSEWFDKNRRILSALVSAGGTTMFTQRASSVGLQNILALPSPDEPLDVSHHEKIVADDIVDYYRDIIRLGEGSSAMKEPGIDALPAFNEVFTSRINSVYGNNKLRALQPLNFDGVLCQPYTFDTLRRLEEEEELGGKLSALLKEKRGAGLSITRIARIYDGSFIFLLKPDRLRYWLQSIALRDADDTLADLWAQGF